MKGPVPKLRHKDHGCSLEHSPMQSFQSIAKYRESKEEFSLHRGSPRMLHERVTWTQYLNDLSCSQTSLLCGDTNRSQSRQESKEDLLSALLGSEYPQKLLAPTERRRCWHNLVLKHKSMECFAKKGSVQVRLD
jgi:hypothetical protein